MKKRMIIVTAFQKKFRRWNSPTAQIDLRMQQISAKSTRKQKKDYAITVPADNHVWIMLHDDNSYYIMYTDKECKELYEPEEDVKEDTHLYAEIESYEEAEDEV